MKFLKLDLLTLLISLFILAGCKNPDNIGLGIDPAKALQANLIDSTTIRTVTTLDDSVATSTDTVVPVSFFKDPVLGTTEANVAASISLPGSSAFTAPTDPVVIDSAVLVLNYAKGFYGDINSTFTMNVYQLNEPLISSKTYYSNKAWNYTPSNIVGTKTFVARPTDTVRIKDIVVGGPDTLKKVVPQLRVPLSATFIRNNFFNATASQLATNQVFQNAIKGLFISTNTSNLTSGHPGGTIFFGMASNSHIDVYYRVIHPAASPDTTVTTLPLGDLHAVQIKHDYSSIADITAQINNTSATASYPNVYLQGLAGLRGKISFPYLTTQKLVHDLRRNSLITSPSVDTNSIVDVAINQAELRVTPVAGSTIPFAPLPRLTLYRWDIAHQRTVVPDAYSSDPRFISVGSFGGFFDTYHQSYSFIITGYIDDLLRGKLKDYGTFIAPTDTTGMVTSSVSISTSPSSQYDGRSVIGGNSASSYRMKLNILYNKVTK